MAAERDPLQMIREMHKTAGLETKKPEIKRAPAKPRNAEEELEAIANKFTAKTARTSDDPLEMMREMSSRFGLDAKKPAVAQKSVERNPEEELKAIAEQFGIGVEDLSAEEIVQVSASEIISRRTQNLGKVMLATGILTFGGNGLAHAQTTAEAAPQPAPAMEVAADQYATEEPEGTIVIESSAPNNQTTETTPSYPEETTPPAETTDYADQQPVNPEPAPAQTVPETSVKDETEPTEDNDEGFFSNPIGNLFNGDNENNSDEKSPNKKPEETVENSSQPENLPETTIETEPPKPAPQQETSDKNLQEREENTTEEVNDSAETEVERDEVVAAQQEAAEKQEEADSIDIPKSRETKYSNLKGKETLDNGVVYYNQTDEKWANYPYHLPSVEPKPGQGNINYNGCGPTSVAMAVASVSGQDVDPTQVADHMSEIGALTSYGASTHTGLEAAPKNWGMNSYAMGNTYDNIKAVTEAGGVVILNGTDSIKTTSGTEMGHIFLVVDVDENGQFIMADPLSRELSGVPQDPNLVLGASSLAIGVEATEKTDFNSNQDEIEQATQEKSEAQNEADRAQAKAERLENEADAANDTEQQQQTENKEINKPENPPVDSTDSNEQNITNTDDKRESNTEEQKFQAKPSANQQNNPFVPDFIENLVDDGNSEDKPDKSDESQETTSKKPAAKNNLATDGMSNIDALVGIEDDSTQTPRAQTLENANQTQPQNTENETASNPTDALVGIGNNNQTPIMPNTESGVQNTEPKDNEPANESKSGSSHLDALVGIGNAADSSAEKSNNQANQKNVQANEDNQQTQSQQQTEASPVPSEGMPAPVQPQGQEQEHAKPSPEPKPEPKPEPEPQPEPEPAPEPEMSEEEQEKAAIEPYEPLLDAIARPESGGNYSAHYANAANEVPDFTEMTVGEVRAWQKNYVANGSPSSAVGKYQIMGYTLDDLSAKHNISPNAEFDETLQDQLALSLLDEKGLTAYTNGEITDDQLLYGISQTWAGVPMGEEALKHGKDPYAGYYDGDGLNAAGGTPQEFLEPINGLK